MRILILLLCSAVANAQCPNCSGVNPGQGRIPVCRYVPVCNQYGQCRYVTVCQ